MKRMIGILLALALGMACFAAAAEDISSYRYDQPDAAKYEGNWVSEDGNYILEAEFGQSSMDIGIVRTTGEKTFLMWEYLTEYDPGTGALTSVGGDRAENRIVTEDNIDLAEGAEMDEDVKAEFSLDEGGKLIWNNQKEAELSRVAFDRIGWFAGDYTCAQDDAVKEGFIKVRYNVAEKRYDVEITVEDFTGRHEWQMQGTYNAEKDCLELTGVRVKKEGQEGADPEQTEVTGVLDFTEDMKLHFTTPENPELEKTVFAWERERPVHIWMWNAQ